MRAGVRIRSGFTVAVAAAALAAAATVAAATVAPARAAGPVVDLPVPETYYLLPPGVTPSGGHQLELFPEPGAGVAEARDVTVEVDASGLKDLVKIRARRDCGEHAAGSRYVFTCEAGRITRSTEIDGLFIQPRSGTKAGAGGTIRYTLTAAGLPPVTLETEVFVGGPKLLPREEKPFENIGAGSSLAVTPALLNRGGTASRGVGLHLQSSDGLPGGRRFSNCHYAAAGRAGTEAYCLFDTEVRPQQAYEVSAPFAFTASETLTEGWTRYSWFPPGAGEPWAFPHYGKKRYSTAGSGPELALRPVSGTDGYGDRGGRTEVATSTRSDLQALAEHIGGEVGETVEIDLGTRNAGPGLLRTNGITYEVTPPEGTTFIYDESYDDVDSEVPWHCDPPRSGAPKYVCRTSGTLQPGESEARSFAFRIDKRVEGAEGLVEVVGGKDRPARDDKPGNDVAVILVNPSAGEAADAEAAAERAAAARAEKQPDGAGAGTAATVAAAAVTATALTTVALLLLRRRRTARSGAPD